MKVIRKLDDKGNVIFKTDKKRIFVDLERLKKVSGISVFLLHKDYNDFTRKELPFGTEGKALYQEGKLAMDDEGFLRICDGIVILPIKRLSRKKSNCSIKEAILKHLAHEVNHLSDKDLKGKWWSIFYKLHWLLPWLIVLALGSISLMVLVKLRFVVVPDIVFSLLNYSLPLIGMLMISIVVSTLWTSKEKKADKFAKQALKNPEWLEVVKVSDVSE